MPPHPSHPHLPGWGVSDEARRVTVLATGAVRVIRALRVLRRDRDEGRLTDTAYDQAVADLMPLPGDDHRTRPPH